MNNQSDQALLREAIFHLILEFSFQERMRKMYSNLIQDFYENSEESGPYYALFICVRQVFSDVLPLLSVALLFSFFAFSWKSFIKMQASIRYLKTPTSQLPMPPKAPLFGRFLLKAFVGSERRNNAIGDAEAEFAENWKELGRWAAWFLYWEQVTIECFPALWRLVRWILASSLLRHLESLFQKFIS